MNMTEVTCTFCEKKFQKRQAEIDRSSVSGKRHFCSRVCSITWLQTYRKVANPAGNPKNLNAENRRDEFTPFRYFLRQAKPRSEKSGKGYDLTLEYIAQLWEEQGGICPLTGWELQPPLGTRGFAEGRQPRNASLDRIDANKGYTRGNVRYVALIVNLAMSDWGDEAVYEMAEAVVQNRGWKDST